MQATNAPEQPTNAYMLFSKKVPLPALIELCRNLRHMLAAGLSIHDVFRQQAKRGSIAIRPIAQRICEDIEDGESVEAALRKERDHFPFLFVDMAAVGEQTGNLAEIFGDLEKYYQRQYSLWKQFLSQITLPVLQFVAAVVVITGLIYILGVIGGPGATIDPIGVGTGAGAAGTFLGIVFGTLLILFGSYLLASRTLTHKAMVDRVLLKIPAIGPCVYALAMTRFCTALSLTMESALPINKALKLSLRSAGNAAFEAATENVQYALKTGEDLTAALSDSGVFPSEFINIIAVAEESGRLPEVMKHQAQYYEEESARKLAIATRIAGFAVWLLVAGIIITAIFRIFSTIQNVQEEAIKGF